MLTSQYLIVSVCVRERKRQIRRVEVERDIISSERGSVAVSCARLRKRKQTHK